WGPWTGRDETVVVRLRGSGAGHPAAVRALGDLQNPRERKRAARKHIVRAGCADAGRDRRRDPGALRLPPSVLAGPGAAARQGPPLSFRRLRARRGPGSQTRPAARRAARTLSG